MGETRAGISPRRGLVLSHDMDARLKAGSGYSTNNIVCRSARVFFPASSPLAGIMSREKSSTNCFALETCVEKPERSCGGLVDQALYSLDLSWSSNCCGKTFSIFPRRKLPYLLALSTEPRRSHAFPICSHGEHACTQSRFRVVDL